jgi:triacylglycerol lipase
MATTTKNVLKLLALSCLNLQACAMLQLDDPKPDVRAGNECVILLHGIVRTSRSMQKMEESLLDRGYKVANWSYPSRKQPIGILAEEAIPQAVESCSDPSIQRINFVTHSMGGILIRYYLANNQIDGLGRVVMLSPPNQGSELIDIWSDWPGFELINGPAGYQLGTDEKSLPLQLGPANFEVGIITGENTTNPFFSIMIPGDDDGKVSVKSARLQGMADFLVVPEAHSFIMRDDAVIRQSTHFLQHGRFNRSDDG